MLVVALIKVFKWCENRGVHEFTMKDVRELLGEVSYTKFSDWVYFGGLVYKNKRAHYGLNRERVIDFITGKSKIQTLAIKDPLTKEITYEDYRTINEVANLAEHLDAEGEFIARYRGNVDLFGNRVAAV